MGDWPVGMAVTSSNESYGRLLGSFAEGHAYRRLALCIAITFCPPCAGSAVTPEELGSHFVVNRQAVNATVLRNAYNYPARAVERLLVNPSKDSTVRQDLAPGRTACVGHDISL
jgi:hypothetical protein